MQLQTRQEDVHHLLGEMRALLIENKRFNELSDQLETLVMAHIEPREPDPWIRAYGLTVMQARLATFLHSKLGKDCSRHAIMNALYFERPNEEPDMKTLDVYVCHIRRKIKDSQYQIVNVWGKGYKMIERHSVAA